MFVCIMGASSLSDMHTQCLKATNARSEAFEHISITVINNILQVIDYSIYFMYMLELYIPCTYVP